MSKLESVPTQPGAELLMYTLGEHPWTDKGWNFSSGDPELWKFKDQLLVPGGKVLDLGIGQGRLATFFALQGMSVTGYDTNQSLIADVQEMAQGYNLPITVHAEDIRTADLGEAVYDTVLLGQTFNHAHSKEEAFAVLDKAIRALRPGGHLWLRTIGKLDSGYEAMFEESQSPFSRFSRLDRDTFQGPSSCSGELQMESYLFLNPIETLREFATNNMDFVHTQVIPTPGKFNIMYGEDWQSYRKPEIGGMITVIARKKSLK